MHHANKILILTLMKVKIEKHAMPQEFHTITDMSIGLLKKRTLILNAEPVEKEAIVLKPRVWGMDFPFGHVHLTAKSVH